MRLRPTSALLLAVLFVTAHPVNKLNAQTTTSGGGQVTDVLTITLLNVLSFNGIIQFTCNMLTGNFGDTIPAPACTFSPASVSPGANTASTTMTVTAQPAAKLAAAGLW